MGTTKNNIINGNEIKRKSNELCQLGWTLDIHVIHYIVSKSPFGCNTVMSFIVTIVLIPGPLFLHGRFS